MNVEMVAAPTVATLYSGIGGWDLAFAYAGWSIAWQCEINRYRNAVLQRHWPGVPRYDDGTSPLWTAPPVDCLIAACPTQTFLDRSTVHEAVWRRIREASPTWVIVETTTGHDPDRAYAITQIEAAGYEVEEVPAAYGNREWSEPVNWLRVLLIGRKREALDTGWTWNLVTGCQFVAGEVARDPDGLSRQRYGVLGNAGGDTWMAHEVCRAMGYPDGWLFGDVPLEMAQAVRDTTAVPVALDLARLLIRPAWKGML